MSSRAIFKAGFTGRCLPPLALGLTLISVAAQSQNRESCPKCLDGNLGVRETARLGPLAPRSDSWTVRKRVNEVTVFFTATDRHGFIQDLALENISVTDDHKPVAKITGFRRQRDLPLRLGLLVDTSGSVNPRFRFEQQAAIQFLRTIVRRDLDRAFVLGFSDRGSITQDYSDDPELLASGVTALRNGGGTALFDAIGNACDKLATAEIDDEASARIIIVLSDGDDNASSTTLKQALNTAQMREVTVYTINTRIDTLDPHDSNATANGDAALKRLAEQSGGRFFSRMSASGVARAFSAIDQEMRNRYALFYQPNNLIEDGRFRRIRIAARKSGRRFRVHARKGYYARGTE
jgi:Ca-activated chloride channel homolog